MIEYKDSYDDKTFIEIIPVEDGSIRFVMLKPRSRVFEKWDIETAKKILTELQQGVGDKCL